MSRALMALSLAVFTLSAQSARADAVAMDTCPPDWVWVRHGHGGACEPASCEPSCDGECVEVARCFETTPLERGDEPPEEPRRTYERPLPTTCDANDACGGTAHCVHTRECRPRQGGCSASSLAARDAGWPALVLAGVLAGRCRRRRRG